MNSSWKNWPSLSVIIQNAGYYLTIRIFLQSQIGHIFHCRYIQNFVYPVIHQRTLGLLSPFYCCEQCSYEHECTNIFLDPDFNSFGYIPRSRITGSYGNSIFIFFFFLEGPPYYFLQQLHHYTAPLAVSIRLLISQRPHQHLFF